MINLKEAGRRIATLRASKDIGQVELAAEVGCSRSTIAGIESGGDRAGIETAVAIADYFKVPLDWLLGRRVPPGGPLVGQFVEDPDKLALLQFWESLSEADRLAATRLLRIPNAADRAA